MRLKGPGLALTFLSIALLPPMALARGGTKDDGKIVEQATFALPTFEQVPDRFKRLYGREAVERELAIKNYKRSLELNPQNANAAAALKRIGQ